MGSHFFAEKSEISKCVSSFFPFTPIAYFSIMEWGYDRIFHGKGDYDGNIFIG